MRIAITGATGFVGGHLIRSLWVGGFQTHLLARRIAMYPGLPATTVEAVDCERPESLLGSMDGCDALVHLVGIHGESGRATFDRYHRVVTKRVLAEAAQAGISRVIYVSAFGADPRSSSRFLRSKFSGEEIVRNSGMKWTILRPSVLFGAGDVFSNRLALLFRLPVVPVIGDGTTLLQPVWVGDLVSSIRASLFGNQAIGKTYDVLGPEAMPVAAIMDTIQTALGVSRRPRVHFSPRSARNLARIFSAMPGMILTRDQVPLFTEGACGDPLPAKLAFGLACRPFDVAAARGYLRPGNYQRIPRRRQLTPPSEDEVRRLTRRSSSGLRIVGADPTDLA